MWCKVNAIDYNDITIAPVTKMSLYEKYKRFSEYERTVTNNKNKAAYSPVIRSHMHYFVSWIISQHSIKKPIPAVCMLRSYQTWMKFLYKYPSRELNVEPTITFVSAYSVHSPLHQRDDISYYTTYFNGIFSYLQSRYDKLLLCKVGLWTN